MSDAEVFGNLDKNRNAMFQECINMVLDIWAGEAPYNLEGEYYSVSTANTMMPDDEVTLDYVLDRLVIYGDVASVTDQTLGLHDYLGDFGQLPNVWAPETRYG